MRNSGENSSTTLGELENFKRIHSRQNRELVRLNVAYARHIRKLEDELHELRAQYIELMQRNLDLQRATSTMQETRSIERTNYQHTSANSAGLETPKKHTSTDRINRDQDIALSDYSNRRETRRKERKCYTLPDIKSKLRKGDPFTFGDNQPV